MAEEKESVRHSLRSAFVTGATGCIGSALTARLSQVGVRVVALVRDPGRATHLHNLPGVEIVAGDLFAHAEISKAMQGCDVVFHLAAKVHANERESRAAAAEFTHINVAGTRSVLDAAVASQVPGFVFFSTVAVYPESDDELDELTPPAPATPYGQSKLTAEQFVLTRAAESDLRAVVLRPTVVYGPRDRGNVSRLIEAIRRRRFFIIGEGTNCKSMVAVENVVEAALLAAVDERARSQIYNVCDARAYTLNEIAATVAEAMGRNPRFPRLPHGLVMIMGRSADVISRISRTNLSLSSDRVKKLTMNSLYSAAKIERELGFRPGVELKQGLARLIAQ